MTPPKPATRSPQRQPAASHPDRHLDGELRSGDARVAWLPSASTPGPPTSATADAAARSAGQALAWLDRQGPRVAGPVLVVSRSLGVLADHPRLQSLARAGHRVTPRTGNRAPRLEPRAVLAYLPTRHALALAEHAAHGGVLCAVEHPDTPLTGWAWEAGAVDLRTGRRPAHVRDPEHQGLLQHLDRLGERGWRDRRSARDTRAVLVALAQGGWLDPADLTAFCLARGHPRQAVLTLLALAAQAQVDTGVTDGRPERGDRPT